MVLVDPEQEKTLSLADAQLDVDWCPYEGIRVKGVPILTVSRGEVVVEDGRFTGERGRGQFIRRRIDPEVLRSPVV
jgi:dihydropyrimidinase